MVSDARSCASAVEAYRTERRAFAEQTEYLSKSPTVSLLMERTCLLLQGLGSVCAQQALWCKLFTDQSACSPMLV